MATYFGAPWASLLWWPCNLGSRACSASNTLCKRSSVSVLREEYSFRPTPK